MSEILPVALHLIATKRPSVFMILKKEHTVTTWLDELVAEE